MELDILRFFGACNPADTLVYNNEEERRYYIDFSSVRGGNIIRTLEKAITRNTQLGKPTCQLFTGHIGCGKSTELMKLQAILLEKDFHVVYFKSSEDLEINDLEITDIFLAITHKVSESLETVGIKLRPNYFVRLFQEIVDFLKTDIDLAYKNEFSLPFGLGKLIAKTKNNPSDRSRLRQYLEPKKTEILDAINKEVFAKATEKLKEQGKQGLVVIVDNFDQMDNRPKFKDLTQPEYIFVENGGKLRKLNCHVVYTIPFALRFSPKIQVLNNRLGDVISALRALPMIPVRNRNGSKCEEGLALLQDMVLARAFPALEPQQRIGLIPQVFESSETLERLFLISGGHVRNVLKIVYQCLLEDDPPISQACIERVIRDYCNNSILGITDENWELLYRVSQEKTIRGQEDYSNLLRLLWVFEYSDPEGETWFDINPVLKESKRFRSFES